MPYILQGGAAVTMTSIGDLTGLVKTYYDRMLLETLDPETKFYQFGVKKPLPHGEGNAVTWNRPRRLGYGQKLTAGIRPSANELSTVRCSALIEVYGGYTLVEDLVQATAIVDPLEIATQELGKQAAETIDKATMQAILLHDDAVAGTSSVHVIKSSSTGIYISTNAFIMNTLDDTLIAVSDIRYCTTELRRRRVPTVDGQNYVGIMHPAVAGDMRSDATWQNWHQYTTPEYLYRGEIGRVEGVRFVETDLTPISAASTWDPAEAASGINTALAYGTVIFGRGFYGVTELDGGVHTYLVTGASKSDPLNQAATYGWKAFYTAKVLNVSAGLTLWNGSGDIMSTVSTASSREAAGCNFVAIQTAL